MKENQKYNATFLFSKMKYNYSVISNISYSFNLYENKTYKTKKPGKNISWYIIYLFKKLYVFIIIMLIFFLQNI